MAVTSADPRMRAGELTESEFLGTLEMHSNNDAYGLLDIFTKIEAKPWVNESNPQIFHMRWQDLIYLKCPICSSRLEVFNGHVTGYWCKQEWCGFTISRRKLVQIFLDEKHVLRSYLTAEQLIHLDEAIEKIFPMKGRSM